MQEENYNKSEQNNEQVKKSRTSAVLVNYALIFAFVLLTAGAGIFTVISEDRTFSESENRMLIQAPELSLDGIMDGSFMSDFENWLSDQFPLRDEAIVLKTDFNRLSGKKEENGVYIGKNNRLFEFPSEYNTENNKKKISAVNSFFEKYPELDKLVAIVPNSSFIYSDELPSFLTLEDQSGQINEIYASFDADNLKKADTVSILSQMKDNGTELYYKTDHHWTTRAAHGVFLQIADIWQLDKNTDYSFYTVTDSFEGTLSSKSGVHDVKDAIEICVPDGSVESYTVNFESLQTKTATLFDESKLSTKNKYEVFLGGNYDIVTIETTAPNDKCLLIIKDSYANCMIPMLTAHFSQIVIADPRYMTDTMDTVMSEYDFTHVLILYNLNTFNEDSALYDVFCDK